MSVYYSTIQQYNWIATNGSNPGNRKTSQIKRRTILYPDSDEAGRKGFKKLAENLSRRGIENSTIDLLRDRSDGHDLADYLVDDLQKEISQIK